MYITYVDTLLNYMTYGKKMHIMCSEIFTIFVTVMINYDTMNYFFSIIKTGFLMAVKSVGIPKGDICDSAKEHH